MRQCDCGGDLYGSLTSPLIVVLDTTSSSLASSPDGLHATAWTSSRNVAKLGEHHESCTL